jgi:hypothetical protein
MRNVKLRTGRSPITALDKDAFERETRREPPYYPDANTMYPFAVCPQCDNPVKIIGFYKDITPAPYAEHHEGSVAGLAEFDGESKRFCIYHDRRKTTEKTERRRVKPSFANDVKDLLRTQYDRVIYILEKALGFHITAKLADEMMRSFAESTAWEYSWTTLNNLPWVFAYMQPSKTLMGRLIDESGGLYASISKRCAGVGFEASGKKAGHSQLVSRGGFANVGYCLMHHRRAVSDGVPRESVTYLVTQKKGGGSVTIHEEPIAIDETYLLNMANNTGNESKRHRKDELCEIARKHL